MSVMFSAWHINRMKEMIIPTQPVMDIQMTSEIATDGMAKQKSSFTGIDANLGKITTFPTLR